MSIGSYYDSMNSILINFSDKISKINSTIIQRKQDLEKCQLEAKSQCQKFRKILNNLQNQKDSMVKEATKEVIVVHSVKEE